MSQLGEQGALFYQRERGGGEGKGEMGQNRELPSAAATERGREGAPESKQFQWASIVLFCLFACSHSLQAQSTITFTEGFNHILCVA